MIIYYYNHDNPQVEKFFTKNHIPFIETKNISCIPKVVDIIFIHDKIDLEWWIDVSKKLDCHIVFMSTKPAGLDIHKHRSDKVHYCLYPADRLSSISRVKSFFEDINNLNWSLLIPESTPDYLIAARILLIACKKDKLIESQCKEYLNDFWELLPNELDEAGAPKTWESIFKLDRTALQQLNETLQNAIASRMGR
jgi:hypothetical protein